MRIRKLVNVSNEVIEVKHLGGLVSILPPGQEIHDTTIIDEETLKGKTYIVADLTEVNEEDVKTKLYD